MNRSKDLRDLFRRSLINRHKNSCGHSPYYDDYYRNRYGSVGGVLDNVHRVPGQNHDASAWHPRPIMIYFYEWSDITKAPRSFSMIDTFKGFLLSSGIYLELYEEEIIRNLGTVYVTCYRGTKNLSIRSTYGSLADAMSQYDVGKMASSIQKPKVIYEPVGRLPESDGTFFG